jgi:GNAT superfamily N-acetyltransferase
MRGAARDRPARLPRRRHLGHHSPARERKVPAMSEAAAHWAIEALRDGRRIEIALRPEDRDGMVAAFGRASAQSLRRRFFSVRRNFTEKEIAFFVNVDFVDHVALVAVAEEGGKPAVVGGGRYIVVEPGQAEIAFAVIDAYQGQGIGAALMRHPSRSPEGPT